MDRSVLHGLVGNAPVGESPQKAEWQPMRTLILPTTEDATGRVCGADLPNFEKKSGANAVCSSRDRPLRPRMGAGRTDTRIPRKLKR